MLARILLVALVAGLVPSEAAAQLDPITNAGACPVSTGYNASDTSIVLATGCGATLPTAAANYAWCNVTDYPNNCKNTAGALDPNYEIVRCTRSTDTLTCTRNTATEQQYGASTKNTAGKTYWVSTLTAKMFADIDAGRLSALDVDGGTLAVDATNNRTKFGGLGLFTLNATITAPELTSRWQEAHGADATSAANAIYAYGGAVFTSFFRANGTAASKTALSSGNNIGAFTWAGWDGSAWSTNRARVAGLANENWSGSAQGTRLDFDVTPNGGTTMANAASLTSSALTLASAVALNIQNATHSIWNTTWGTAAEGIQVTQDSAGLVAWTVNGTGTVPTDAAGKIEFDPATGQWRWYADRRGGTWRPHLQLETDIAASGVEYTDTTFTVLGRVGTGAVPDYWSSQINLSAETATNAFAAYGWGADGTHNGSAFGSNTHTWLFDTINSTHIWRHTQADPAEFQIGDVLSSKGISLRLYGRAVTQASATGAVSGVRGEGSFTYAASDTTTLVHYGDRRVYTITSAAGVANKTLHLDDVDSINANITGVSATLLRRIWGGAVKFSVDSSGNVSATGSITAVGADLGADAIQTTEIANDQVTYAKLQNAAANAVLARAAGTSGDVGEVSLSASQLLGRGSTGDVAAIALGSGLSMTGTTLSSSAGSPGGTTGDVQYHNGAGGFAAEAAFNYDAAANQLTSPGVAIAEDLAVTGDISPAQLTTDQNDWSPTGLSTATIIRVDTDNVRHLTGLATGADGRVLTLIVLETAQGPLVLRDQSSSSSAANRFILPTRRLWLWPGDILTLYYDATSSRWRVFALPHTAGTAIDLDYQQVQEEFYGGVRASGTATEAGESLGVAEWISTASGTAANTSPAGVAGHPGIIQLVTGTTSGNDTRLHLGNSATDDLYQFQDIRYFGFLVRTTDNTSNRIKVGLGTDVSDPAVGVFGTDGVFFEFDTATSANWRVLTRAASSNTLNTTTVAVANNGWDLLEAVRLTNGNWVFMIDEAIVFTHTATLPTTTMANLGVFVETQTAAARNVQVDWAMFRTNRLGSRFTP